MEGACHLQIYNRGTKTSGVWHQSREEERMAEREREREGGDGEREGGRER